MLYLYMVRRDKKGMRLITTFHGNPISPTQIFNIKDLNLPDIYTGNFEKTIAENKMMWEFWIESANSFDELKNRLAKKGYQKLPFRAAPLHKIKPSEISESNRKPIIPSIKNMSPKKKMVQRKSAK